MRVIVVGMGVQGEKRKRIAGSDCVATVDSLPGRADFVRTEDVPLASFDAALLCVPDKPKIQLTRYLLNSGKHVLVEKPLWSATDSDLTEVEALAHSANLMCYTAYNHRFEPHFLRMRDLIRSDVLGKIYRCRIFYGNGTARLVRDSTWRDNGSGVLHDLGSHVLDTTKFWFGDISNEFLLYSSNCFENFAPDCVTFGSESGAIKIEYELSLLSWRNSFQCDIFAENGSAHIDSLCKWGPTTFIHRTRVLPSGRPNEEVVTIEQPDSTWLNEYRYFTQLCSDRKKTNLSNDLWLNRLLRTLGESAIDMASK